VGRYRDDVTAARAYDKAAVYLYGSKAILNFSMEVSLPATVASHACSLLLCTALSSPSGSNAWKLSEWKSDDLIIS
jgi:hypothetical protein